MSENDLSKDLRIQEVEQSELELLLNHYFGQAVSSRESEVLYFRGESECLKLLYDKNGIIKEVQRGPGLSQDDLVTLCAKVSSELLTRSLTIHRQILFAPVPTRSAFRYRDEFQLLPMPEEAPQTNQHGGDHPLLLEFKIAKSNIPFVVQKRVERRLREYELVLNTLLCFRVKSIGTPVRFHWVTASAGEGVGSAYKQEGYFWPLRTKEDDFTPTNTLPQMDRRDPKHYYETRGIHAGQALDLPSNVEQLLSAIYGLAPVDRERLLRASYWFSYSGDVFLTSRSASFGALVSAIEAIMPEPVTTKDRCSACNRNLGPGPTKLFVEFVDKYAPDGSVNQRDRREFYRLRSALSHGGKLLHEDKAGWGFTAQRIKEDRDFTSMWGIVRIARYNWLLEHSLRSSTR